MPDWDFYHTKSCSAKNPEQSFLAKVPFCTRIHLLSIQNDHY